jgi:hypothetical protein
MVNRNRRERLENDPDRDMSHVPGTYNPGNQAGKSEQTDGQRPTDEPREKLENDLDRNTSDVPGTYNPGNQAGKGEQGGGLRPTNEPGGSSLTKKRA